MPSCPVGIKGFEDMQDILEIALCRGKEGIQTRRYLQQKGHFMPVSCQLVTGGLQFFANFVRETGDGRATYWNRRPRT